MRSDTLLSTIEAHRGSCHIEVTNGHDYHQIKATKVWLLGFLQQTFIPDEEAGYAASVTYEPMDPSLNNVVAYRGYILFCREYK